MKRINSVIKGESKKVQTTDVKKISYYVRDHNPPMTLEDAEDYNASSQYLVSDNGKFIAKYNKELNAVGFYEESGEDVKHLTHTTPEKLDGTVFTIEEETEIDLLNDVLPQGDILIKFTDDSVYLPDNESVSDSVNYLADNDWDSVNDIIYTGLSRGNTENAIVELTLDDEEPEEAECGVDCDCFGFCAETGELV
uniref:Virion component n=1 Tax=Staphylococcus phage 184DA TaxID=3110532 RepID=A0AAU6MXH5_9CAUD